MMSPNSRRSQAPWNSRFLLGFGLFYARLNDVSSLRPRHGDPGSARRRLAPRCASLSLSEASKSSWPPPWRRCPCRKWLRCTPLAARWSPGSCSGRRATRPSPWRCFSRLPKAFFWRSGVRLSADESSSHLGASQRRLIHEEYGLIICKNRFTYMQC